MVIEMKNQNVSLIKSYKGINETMYPEDDLKEDNRYLSGFKWHDDARPKDKDDIFRTVEAEMPKAEPNVTPEESSTDVPEEENKELPKRNRKKVK